MMVVINSMELIYSLTVKHLTTMEEIVMQALIGSKINNQNSLPEESKSDNKEDDGQSLMGSDTKYNELCPDCHGSGSLADTTCSSCNGAGVI